MRDQTCVQFLQWCLPRLDLRWPGYRKVRGTVCKRVGRRLRELGLADVDDYRAFLERTPEEWARLDALCRIPISRFCRDRGVFDYLGHSVLPELAAGAAARGGRALRCWSAGCASGEEVYTLRLIWDLSLQATCPTVRLTLLGTDADATMLKRAAAACYPAGSLKELPAAWLESAFTRAQGLYSLRVEFRSDVSFREQDIRRAWPEGPFHLVLCRNLAFTYFVPALQARVLRAIETRLCSGGYLVIGSHETLPDSAAAPVLVPAAGKLPVYRKA